MIVHLAVMARFKRDGEIFPLRVRVRAADKDAGVGEFRTDRGRVLLWLAGRFGERNVGVESERGDEFLTFKHKAVGQVATTDPNLHGRIAEVDGESYRLGDQYIAPALVKLYTLDQGAGDESAN